MTTVDLHGSPYSLEDTGRWALDEAASLQERVELLRGEGRLSEATLRAYFGEKRFEQIAESLPSVILRRKDRLRYYEALAESDLGGDLGPISELILARAEDALRELERKATAHEGYDRAQAQLRRAQERQVAIWNDAVQLLFSLVDDALDAAIGDVGQVSTRWYEDELLVEDYAALSRGDPAGNSWLYRINVEVPALRNRRLLAWTGYRSYGVQGWQGIGAGPSIFWSVPDRSGYRHWIRDDSRSPGVAELTLQLPNVDTWIARLPDGGITRLLPSEVAQRIAYAVIDSMTES